MNSDFKERTWSLLDKKPQFFYSKRHDIYFVIWEGDIFTREEAIYSLLEIKRGIHASRKIRLTNFENYLQLYRTGTLEKYTDEINLGWGIPNAKQALTEGDDTKKLILALERSKYVLRVMHRIIRGDPQQGISGKYDEASLQDLLKLFEYDKAMIDD